MAGEGRRKVMCVCARAHTRRERESWCFKPSQSQRLTSGLRNFHKEICSERTDRKNSVRKRGVVGKIYGMKYS